MTFKVPPNEPVRHWARLDSQFTACGVERRQVTWTDEPETTPVTCTACRLSDGQPADVRDQRALEESLRDSASYVDAVFADAATEDARDLAELLPKSMHYCPPPQQRILGETPCGIDIIEMQPERVTTDLGAVTCQECKRLTSTSPLPAAELVERDCGNISVHEPHDFPDAAGDTFRCPGGWTEEQFVAVFGEPKPERRTVGPEVLTDELRPLAAAEYTGDSASLLGDAVVGLVWRTGDQATAVTDVDTDWVGGPGHVFACLMRQALERSRYVGDVDLLMPTPDVLAALSGEPVGSYTRSVPSSYGVVEPGWFVRVETVVDGRGDVVWLLVEDRRECDVWRDCPVAGGEPHVCHVVTVRGRGIQHIQSWMPVSVRIPAHTEVEPR